MASGTKIVFEFKDSDGKTVQYSYNYGKPSATAQQVNAHAASMITNTAVLARTLVSISKIKQVVTSESEYEIANNALATPRQSEIINGNPEIPDTDDNTAATITEIKPPATDA